MKMKKEDLTTIVQRSVKEFEEKTEREYDGDEMRKNLVVGEKTMNYCAAMACEHMNAGNPAHAAAWSAEFNVYSLLCGQKREWDTPQTQAQSQAEQTLAEILPPTTGNKEVDETVKFIGGYLTGAHDRNPFTLEDSAPVKPPAEWAERMTKGLTEAAPVNTLRPGR